MNNLISESKGSILSIIFTGDNQVIWREELCCLFLIKSRDGTTWCDLTFQNANQLEEHAKSKGQQSKKIQLSIDNVLRTKK